MNLEWLAIGCVVGFALVQVTQTVWIAILIKRIRGIELVQDAESELREDNRQDHRELMRILAQHDFRLYAYNRRIDDLESEPRYLPGQTIGGRN